MCVTSIVNFKSVGIKNRKNCAASGHRNVQLLNPYDHPTRDEMKTLATAVDKENVEPVSEVKSVGHSHDGESRILSAAGSTWNNITVNTVQPLTHKHQPEKED